jgi:glucans biosynthesis protein C
MKRIYFIDWLRILAIAMVFIFHNCRFFDTLDWHVKNAQQSQGVLIFVGFINIWIMPLFFLLSGASGIFGMNKSFGKYSFSKTMRLLVPYVMGVVLLIPPQKYLEAVTHYHYTPNFLHFLGVYFSGGIVNYPMGFNSLWIGAIAYHLWFLGHLFVISLVLYPVMKYLAGKGAGIIEWVYRKLSFYGGLILLFVPVAIVRILLKKSFPDYTGWADLAIFGMYFLYGFILMKKEGFRGYFLRDRLPALITGVVLTSAYFLSFGMKGTLLNEIFQNNKVYGFYMFQESMGALASWSCLIVIMGMGIKYLDKEASARTKLNEAVLPFYILHQTVILTIGFFVVQWDWNNWAKFFTIASSSLLITVAIYTFLIKPLNGVRFFFGMSRKGKVLT